MAEPEGSGASEEENAEGKGDEEDEQSEQDEQNEEVEEGNEDQEKNGAPDWTLPANLHAVRSTLLEWYEDEHRSLPWRETTDPYEILVAEVMSQQTQLDRVVGPWEEFLDRWPTVEALAAADRSAVVSFWTAHNLGYNNRARYLHEAATQVVEDHGGEVPEDPEGLTNLMGVGPYTANAVASFAFNAGGAVVDTNVKRILHRAFGIPDDDAAFEEAAGGLMPDGRSRRWNNAIMELGGVVCTPAPSCDDADCPWRRWCAAYRTGDFSAPDVPEQEAFEGSRRQMRGRVVSALAEHGPLPLDELGPRIRVDYAPEGERGRSWLLDLLTDLESDGLVVVDQGEEPPVARLG